MKPHNTEQTNRLRTILQRMERSIDDARARRVDGPGRADAVTPPLGVRSCTRCTPGWARV